MTPLSTPQTPASPEPVGVPVRLYSALRTSRIYPPANPQVRRTAEQLYHTISAFLAKEQEVTIACTGKSVLVNGQRLSGQEQERPQVKGMQEMMDSLQIHTLTFLHGFSADDCLGFLEIFSAINPKGDSANTLKKKLAQEGLQTVSVDERRYVAIHDGEVVMDGEGGGGLPFDLRDLSLFLRGRGAGGAGEDTGTVAPGTGNDPVRSLLSRIESAESPGERSGLVDQSASMLTGLDPRLLAQLLALLSAEKAAVELVERTVKRLDDNQLEALLLRAMDRGDSKSLLETLDRTDAAPQIHDTVTRVRSARDLLALGDRVTPQDLVVALRQPEWSAPVLATALRQVAGHDDDQSGQQQLTGLLNRYERELPDPVGQKVAETTAGRLARLQEQELGRILGREFHGGFGNRLYEALVDRLTDEQFEQVARELNFIAQGKLGDTAGATDGCNAYQRFMQTVRGQQLQRALEAQQQSAADSSTGLDPAQVLEKMKKLLEGQYHVLEDTTFIKVLPKSLHKLLDRGKDKAADQLLLRLVAGLQREGDEGRGSAEALGQSAMVMAEKNQWQRLEKLVPALMRALPLMEGRASIVSTLEGLTRLVHHYLVQEMYEQAAGILRPLFDLTIQPPAGREELATTARDHLNTLAVPDLLGPVLDRILTGEEEAEQCRYILAHLGPGAAHFLMVRLRESQSRQDRELLIDLIAAIGKPARDALLEHLHGEMEWYVVRNIVRLLRDVGDPDCFATIAPLIDHQDMRVRHEVIETLGVIGGPERKQFFLDLFPQAPEELKPLIVRQLGGTHDEGVVLPLTDALEQSSGPPFADKEPLQLEICRALARLHSKKALPVLKKILKSRDIPGLEDFSPQVLEAVEETVRTISEQDGSVSGSDRPVSVPGRKNDPLAQKEAEIFRKVTRGEKDQAKKELYELVVQCARAKDFANAERLRERIYEIDPMALTEIIRSGEIIEKEKTGAIGRDKLDTWSALLELLTPVEFSAIYHEMEERSYAPEEVVVRQGERNDDLLFIDQGSVKVTYQTGDREVFVSTLNSGQIYGENFFTPSLWTVTLTALTATKISVLKRTSFQRWHEEYPGLENKLQTFHDRCNAIGRELRRKGLERRQYERYELSRKVQVQMVDHNRRPVGRAFRGELVDISLGGLAFLVRISKKENARLLLGRTMRITMPVASADDHLFLEGMAISIHPFHLLESDFSVHVRFLKVIDQAALKQILG